METINIKKTIGKFKEFSEKQQEEIINHYRDINVDFEDWNDYLISDFIQEVKQQTGLEVETDSIIWAVGDRNSKFGVYSKDIINQLISNFADKGVYDIDTTEKLGSFLNHLGGGICRQGQTETGLADIYFEDEQETQTKENKAVIEQINAIIDDIIGLCSKYHNANEENYNSAISDDSVKETLIINDYDFDSETLRIN